MAKAKTTAAVAVDSIRHQDTRKNIPTNELREFMAEDEQTPQTMRYPRDPSLDPQLVWKGKDEQDSQDLAVQVVPIYIQEKIHPQALINALPRQQENQQLDLFADFDGLDDFDQKVDFYHHEQHWANRMILGDSLLVMTSLAEKEGLKGKVQTIYFDPPYGIKFGSNWQVSTRKRDVKDGKAEDATRQPEQVRAFRDTWKLGIHSYLAYMRDRLIAARELLTETGSIFVQIGDENVHLVRNLLDEVFGSENFVSLISFKKTASLNSPMARLNTLGSLTDYLVWYAKNAEQVKYRQIFTELTEEELGNYTLIERPDGQLTSPSTGNLAQHSRRVSLSDTSSMGAQKSFDFGFEFQGKLYHTTPGRHWSTTQSGLQKLSWAGRLFPKGERLFYKRYADDFPVRPLGNLWDDTQFGGFLRDEKKVYVVQTLALVIQRAILMTTDPGDLVLDPTCGSGTTAYVAEQWGRRWMTIDTSRVAVALARTRLMVSKYPYFFLADSPEGIHKEADLTGQRPTTYQTANDIRKGFVYKRVPHVTLKSIANNTDLREGMSRAEIDAAIARHADTEILYDQPYEDNKRIRVSGPFTVESLSPHRVLSTDEDLDGVVSPQEAQLAQDFTTMILDNLKAAGVQNTRKNERLKFDRLEPFSGVWLQAAGEYTDADQRPKRVAIAIGPEHGTVGPQQVKEAAKEALQGIGFDLLIVCGFAFDALAGETANEFKPVEAPPRKGIIAEQQRQYGKLPVLLARVNPDLAMGDELLKKTGAGNLFMVFGEPDVDIRREAGGQVSVEIKGVDVYDPTTGEIRSSSTDQIACWFIDTDYNGESFFVRHAYFTGAEEPYEKLQRALRAEIDEAAWASLYSTISRPFPAPSSGKIAVKVINHYGDEVLKVFKV